VVAIDPATGALVWQYGITGKLGTEPGELNTPDGFDLLLPAKHAASREVQGLLKVLTSPWLLAQLASLPGYDATRCGERPA